MLDRAAVGELPPKHHVALASPSGSLCYEQCITRAGFDGGYSILYHLSPPQALVHVKSEPLPSTLPSSQGVHALKRRHFRTQVASSGTLFTNTQLAIGVASIAQSDSRYRIRADADELWYVQCGQATLRSAFGDLEIGAGDYVCVPKGVLHRRLVRETEALRYLRIECQDLRIPSQFRNALGQLRMDAPYCHRDFRRPVFTGPRDEGLREVVVERAGATHVFSYAHGPLDVVGWDGTVYPWAFPIAAFQPRVSSVHLPPTWHGTFAAEGALICSFVPRPLDFGAGAIPCPYPHASVDVDEVIYYASGALTSRSGVEVGSLTLHPSGIAHGPQPGRYEASLGHTQTDELAVMLDCYAPLQITAHAEALEDPNYEASFTQAPDT